MPDSTDQTLQLPPGKTLKSLSNVAPQSNPDPAAPLVAFLQFYAETNLLFSEMVYKLRDADGEIDRLRQQVVCLQVTLEERDSSLAKMEQELARARKGA